MPPSVATLTITEGKCTRNKGTALKGPAMLVCWSGVAQITRNLLGTFPFKQLFLLVI